MQFDLATQTVDRISFDFGITLLFSDGTELRITTPCEIRSSGGEVVTVDPENLGSDLRILPLLLHQAVQEAQVDEASGAVDVSLRSGSHLRVGPDPDFEAWSLTAPDGSLIVSLPGGGTSRWKERS